MILLFVRHGESTWNIEGRFQGRQDPPLSPLGERQARAVAERLACAVHPGAIVSSPQRRARSTAELIAARCTLPLVLDDRLVEIAHGQWEGLLRSQVAARWPDWLDRWRDEPQTVRFPGGESVADVRARLDAFVSNVSDFASPLIICTHDVIIRLAVLWASGEPMERFSQLKGENAGITRIALENGCPTLIGFNDIGHLGELRSNLAGQAL
ncbi:MAG: histidine phosphatase family protein [Candidatus Eremiobacteraeota bacterium]|nr:histidine phosphatase family protein [Candidatus Eremiobacteraeota bacterium]